MGTQSRQVAAPIFVVGSPRSGTSILTWCLGQLPNILPTEESDWLGSFAVQAAAHHRLGSARGERSQLSALGIESAEFLHNLGNAVDAMIRDHRTTLESLNRAVAQRDPRQVHAEFAVARGDAEPKARWVDGTPEYSLHLCGLHKLFPAAKFIHILRNPDDVAASMLAFHHHDGRALVANADEAYLYWERTTRACLLAAQALGAGSVFRVRHADLVARPETALRDICDFLGETFAPDCLAPLARRINSSFAGEANPAALHKPDATAELVARARQLHRQIDGEAVPALPSTQALAEFEAYFENRVQRACRLDHDFSAAQRLLEALALDPVHGTDWVKSKNSESARAQAFALEKTQQFNLVRRELTICGIVLAVQAACALAAYSVFPAAADARVVWVAVSGAGVLIYAWLRRAGLRQLLARGPAAVAPPSDSTEATP